MFKINILRFTKTHSIIHNLQIYFVLQNLIIQVYDFIYLSIYLLTVILSPPPLSLSLSIQTPLLLHPYVKSFVREKCLKWFHPFES